MATVENKDKAGVFKPKPLFISVLAGFITLVVLFVILSIAVSNMLLPEDIISYLAIAVCAVSSFISAMIYSSATHTRKIVSALISGGSFFVLLLILGFFIPDTSFSVNQMFIMAITILISSMVSAVVRSGMRGGRIHKN